MVRHRLFRGVTVLGLLCVVVGVWSYATGINRWWLVVLQSGLVLSVVGATAITERRHGEWNARRLILVCSVPGFVTTLVVAALVMTGTPLFDTYPLTDSHESVFWLSAGFLVPLQYVLVRTRRTGVQWSVAGLTVLSIVGVPIASVAGLPPALYDRAIAPFSFVLGLACWTAIPVYELGRAIARDRGRVEVGGKAATAIGFVVAGVLLAMGAVTAVWPDDPGTVLLAIVLYGPILYLAGRGVNTVRPLARRG